MEISGIVWLVVSCAISFAIGRTVMHFWRRKQKAQLQAIERRRAQALQDAPPPPESRNRSKRKRQLQQIEKSATKR